MTVDKISLAQAASLLAGKGLWHTQDIPSHHIPSLRTDLPSSRTFNGSKTACFPCASALAATWDRNLVREIGSEMGRQAKAKGVHLVLAPTVNIHRSPLGGRNFEAFSEDPLLSGYLASSLISGMQEQGVGATVKHFVCNDVETDRTKVDVIVQERALREIYLKPFEIVIRKAKPWAVMASYNKVNGLHVSESKHLLDAVLRKEWGFDGVIMSDWWGSYSTSESVNATLDLEMPGAPVWRGADRITRAVACGKVDEKTVRASAKRVLDLVDKAMESGIPENAPQEGADSPDYRELNRRAAASSVVLLKNENHILPLLLESRPKIAVIGPNAIKNVSSGGGSASVNAYHYVSALDGIKVGVADKASVSFAHGCYSDEMLPLMQTVTASGAQGLEIKLFPHPFDFDVQPQPPPVATVTSETWRMFFFDCLPPVALPITWARCEGIFEAESSGEYDFGVATTGRAKLFVDDQLVVDNWSEQKASRAFFGMGTTEVKGRIAMTAGRQYKVSVQYSCISALPDRQPGHLGGGILRVGARLAVERADLVAEAVRLASAADVVVLCLGTDSERETEGFDRTTMSLPEEQDELANSVLDVSDRVVVVNFSGSPVAMPWASRAAAIVQAWFLGSELGNGLADVLLGNVNPSGKLPVSFPVALEQNPSYGNFPGENAVIRYDEGLLVGYRHYTTRGVPPLFPFGHGLSYTTFEYSSLTVSSQPFPLQGCSIAFSVRNSGSLPGDAVVQLYVSPPSSTVARPVRELKGFLKLPNLVPGEARSMDLSLLPEHLAYWDEAINAWVVESGRYRVSLGHSSVSMAIETELMVEKQFEWRGTSPDTLSVIRPKY
ncbi:glycosyl hydrolase family 3 N terminal domain-containing protein [Aspergillus carlsbadensis]|nr:glycosyl hydrolase family 3 N terminal domain-containing protein [Aspergillus carlsbadensis]